MSKQLPFTLSEKEFLEGLSRVKKSKVKLAFLLGFYQCLRVSEVLALQPSHIDKDRGFIHVIAGKGNKDRDIPLFPRISRIIMRDLPIGVTRQALHKQVKKVWPNAHFHTLRHSGATHYLNVDKVDIRKIQTLLGHSRLDTTQIYTHVTPNDLKNAFEEVWK